MTARRPARSVVLGVLALLLGGTGLAAPAGAQGPAGPDPRPAIHDRVLDRPVQGRAARRALDALDNAGQRTVGARNHRTVAQVRALLADPTAGLWSDGKLFYTEQTDATDAVAAAPAAAAPTLSAAETFALHSRSGSNRTIYLDFDGHTLPSGGAWTTGGIPAGTFDAFDEREAGGDVAQTYDAAFTAAERDYVASVWRIVAEKFAAFDVDVTTQDPGAAALNRSSAADPTYGSRAVFTDDRDARGTVCPYGSGGAGCAGIAYVGVFDDDESTEPAAGYYEPAWIYTTVGGYQLGARKAADTAAHEVGHNLNLEHDRTISTSYYGGHDNWYPLMGSSNRPIGQWDDSEFPGAYVADRESQTLTSDIATMNAAGLPTRADDTVGTRPLGDQTSYEAPGIIERREDTDVFTVERTCTDPMTVSATGIGTGQAVDIALTVQPPTGSATFVDPPSGYVDASFTGMDAATTIAGPATGTWTFTVDGVGGTGYSDYGSLGQYVLAISGCPPTIPDSAPGAPTALTTQVADHATTLDVGWTAPADAGKPTLSGYAVTLTPTVGGEPATQQVSGTSASFGGLTPGSSYDVSVVAVNTAGSSAALTGARRVPTWAPTTGATLTATVAGQKATLGLAPPANPGNAVLTGWQVDVQKAGVSAVPPTVLPASATSTTTPTLPAGSYTVLVTPTYDADDPVTVPVTTTFEIAVAPSAPRIGTASSGAVGGKVTATARWAAPTSTGGAAITGYRVYSYRLDSRNRVVATKVSTLRSASSRSLVQTLPAGRWRFRVRAYNRIGASPVSAYSTIVRAR